MPDPEVPDDPQTTGDVPTGYVDVHKNAWNETIEDMWALEEELQAEGWETIETAAGHTGLNTPTGDDERAEMVHIVPDSDGEAISEALQAGEFPKYDVYRQKVDNWVFEVIVLLDPGTEQAILIAAEFELRGTTPAIERTHETGELYTVIKFLDGELVGSLRHESPEKFFPEYESYEP